MMRIDCNVHYKISESTLLFPDESCRRNTDFALDETWKERSRPEWLLTGSAALPKAQNRSARSLLGIGKTSDLHSVSAQLSARNKIYIQVGRIRDSRRRYALTKIERRQY